MYTQSSAGLFIKEIQIEAKALNYIRHIKPPVPILAYCFPAPLHRASQDWPLFAETVTTLGCGRQASSGCKKSAPRKMRVRDEKKKSKQ
jgi:hypothetical protein